MGSRVASTPPVRVAHVAVIDATVRWLLLPQLKALRAQGYDVTAISASGPWKAEIEAEGIHHIAWPHVTRAWSPRSDVLALRELVRILKREQFDLVHTHTPKGGILGRVAARIARTPHVVNTVHGLYATREDPWTRKLPVLALEWGAARLSALELYQSGEDLAWSRRLGVARAGRSVLLGNGTDLQHFDATLVGPDRLARLRREFGVPDDALVVGTVGRLVREKGYTELSLAAREVRKAVPNAFFLAVGPGDLVERDRFAAASASSRDLFFTGMRTDVRDLLALMDVFVLATWREGMPRSAIEASAMGRAMVLTDIRGCREVARDGVEAILVPRQDARALTHAITRLLRDDLLRASLGSAARTRALDLFDEKRVEDVLVSEYRGLLRDGRARTSRDRDRERRPRQPSDRPARSA